MDMKLLLRQGEITVNHIKTLSKDRLYSRQVEKTA